MADKKNSQLTAAGVDEKISQLTAATGINDADLALIVQGGVDKKITSSIIKSAYANVVMAANFAAFPVTGLDGIIYIAKDTELEYRWNVPTASYVQIGGGSSNNVSNGYGSKDFSETPFATGSDNGFVPLRIAYNGSFYISTGYDTVYGQQTIFKSLDGKTWTQHQTNISLSISECIWVSGWNMFVAVTNNYVLSPNSGVYGSTDGVNWTVLNSTPYISQISLCYNPNTNTVLCVGYQGANKLSWSNNNGVTWHNISAYDGFILWRTVYCNKLGLYFVFGQNITLTSPDITSGWASYVNGINVIGVGVSEDLGAAICIGFDHATSSIPQGQITYDGQNWQALITFPSNFNGYAQEIIWNNRGKYWTMSDNSTPHGFFWSEDAITWDYIAYGSGTTGALIGIYYNYDQNIFLTTDGGGGANKIVQLTPDPYNDPLITYNGHTQTIDIPNVLPDSGYPVTGVTFGGQPLGGGGSGVVLVDKFADFPVTGETNKIYIDESTEASYYWTGASYQVLDQAFILNRDTWFQLATCTSADYLSLKLTTFGNQIANIAMQNNVPGGSVENYIAGYMPRLIAVSTRPGISIFGIAPIFARAQIQSNNIPLTLIASGTRELPDGVSSEDVIFDTSDHAYVAVNGACPFLRDDQFDRIYPSDMTGGVSLDLGANSEMSADTLYGKNLYVRANTNTIIDAQQSTANDTSLSTDHWQSWTASNTANLVEIDVAPYAQAPLTAVWFRIYSGVGISGTLLYQDVITLPNRACQISLNSPLAITASNQYTWRLYTSASTNVPFQLSGDSTLGSFPDGTSDAWGATTGYLFTAKVGDQSTIFNVNSDGDVIFGLQKVAGGIVQTDINGIATSSVLPIPTSDEKAAMDGANSPSVSNVFATMADVSGTGAGAYVYMGTWDASGATYPTDPSKGNWWVISVAGTISGTAYLIGDVAAYNGTAWNKYLGSNQNMPTADEKAAMDNANAPTALNPFATIADIPGGGSVPVMISTVAPDPHTSLTPTLTVTDGNDRLVIFAIGLFNFSYNYAASHITSLTWGGISMRRLPDAYFEWNCAATLGYYNAIDFWYMLESDFLNLGHNPSGTLAFTWSSVNTPTANNLAYIWSVYGSAHQIPPFIDVSQASNADATAHSIGLNIVDTISGQLALTYGFAWSTESVVGNITCDLGANIIAANIVDTGLEIAQLVMCQGTATSSPTAITWTCPMATSSPNMGTIGLALTGAI